MIRSSLASLSSAGGDLRGLGVQAGMAEPGRKQENFTAPLCLAPAGAIIPPTRPERDGRRGYADSIVVENLFAQPFMIATIVLMRVIISLNEQEV
jgi:hypothetical protein